MIREVQVSGTLEIHFAMIRGDAPPSAQAFGSTWPRGAIVRFEVAGQATFELVDATERWSPLDTPESFASTVARSCAPFVRHSLNLTGLEPGTQHVTASVEVKGDVGPPSTLLFDAVLAQEEVDGV
jgi:hypothetical protein